MTWSEKTWAEAQPIYEKITKMPFIAELAAGTLPQEKFLYYIAQDDLYLHDYAKALAIVGARAESVEETTAFVQYAQIALISEREMHEGFFAQTPPPAKAAVQQPACHHYTHFLRATAALEPVGVGMAAVLPCFWVYREVGRHIYNNSVEGNPYQSWIDTYVGEEFEALVDGAIALCDAAAERATEAERVRMTEAFVAATRLEFDFWDAGYRLREW